MVAQIISSHYILVEIFLAFLILGFFIPSMTAQKPPAFRKASFIYTMVFQAIATMIAFAGLVAMVMGEYGFTLSIILMILVWAVLMFIEIKKYKVIKTSRIEDPETHVLLKSLFLKITAVEVFLTAAMVLIKFMEAKGAVSLS